MDEFCVACKGKNRNIRESCLHIVAECPEYKNNSKILSEKLLAIINDSLKMNFSTFPWWFHNDMPTWAGDQCVAAPLASFNKELGDRGFIPASLSNFLTNYAKASKVNNAMEKIQLTLAQHLQSRWKERCEFTFKSPNQP
jgi:hypothetical protein